MWLPVEIPPDNISEQKYLFCEKKKRYGHVDEQGQMGAAASSARTK